MSTNTTTEPDYKTMYEALSAKFEEFKKKHNELMDALADRALELQVHLKSSRLA